MDIKQLVNITSRAWAVPILAALHEGVPGRQAPLLTATGAGRTAFAQSMTHLIEIGLVERNPGHGHPLRPEFRLTIPGKIGAEISHKISTLAGEEHRDLLRKSWTLPVLAITHTPHHFNDIQRALDPITDRALSQALKALEEREWVHREVDHEARPPRPTYSAANKGAEISAIMAPYLAPLKSG